MVRDFIERALALCGGCRPLLWLLGVNLAVSFLLWGVTAVGWIGGFSTAWLEKGLSMPADLRVLISRPWTPLTYMVTHYSVIHLLFNMLWLYWFGRMLADVGRQRDLVWIYVGGGLTGALLFVVGAYTLRHGAGTSGWLCGASASVLALTTAAAFISPDMKVRLFLLGDVKLKWLAVATVLLTCLGFGGGNGGAQMAHIGGALFGVGAGMAMRKGFRFPANATPLSLVGRIRMPKRSRRPTAAGVEAVTEAASGRLCDTARLDELLDRIRLSGYGSLSSSERRELDAISRRINRK